MKLVVVESPAKAKTINKYLGDGYHVLASYGHIRDLPSKKGMVLPEDGFAMTWEASAKSEKPFREIKQALKKSDSLILATDPDREGEAISWHVWRMLEEQKALGDIQVQRVVFNEITKPAVLDAMANPRDVDQDLVDAYFARRALDYLIGFTLSEVLWKKLPGSRSAGRVQSVALRLIAEREAEIEVFEPQEFWTIDVLLKTGRGEPFLARLTHIDGNRLDKFDLTNSEKTEDAISLIENADYLVQSISRKRVRRNPHAPFTTSTLQQEASRKLNMGASRTMQLAQRLYEGVEIGGETVGLITYMRTDGVQMSQEAINTARKLIQTEYGDNFVPNAPRIYKTKAKNAQEAHEAIRPTDMTKSPNQVRQYLEEDQARLYDLIWKRSIASQMASAELDQTVININANDSKTSLRANGSVIAFEGFLKVYKEDQDDPNLEGTSDDDKLLPPMSEDECLAKENIKSAQHFTQPPPRFSEASLVKRMEELGIGRPSTYASIMQVLQDRNYVQLEKKRFVPEVRGRLVTSFLSNFFKKYIQYDFTADLETELDEISDGKLAWADVLQKFWKPFHRAIGDIDEFKIPDVLKRIDEDLGQYFFPTTGDGVSTRICPKCGTGEFRLNLGKYGPYASCSNYPDCKVTRQLIISGNRAENPGAETFDEPKILGTDPETNQEVSLRKGPYGFYVQLGEQGEKKSDKPKRASLPKTLSPMETNFEIAVGLLSLPREIGVHPDNREAILAGIGRYGPYLKHDGGYTSIPAGDDVLTIGLNRAVDLIANNSRKKISPKSLGESEGKTVTVQTGRYGPYVQRGTIRATLPKDVDRDTITLERALELIAAKDAKGNKKGQKRVRKSE
ncbi:MAG: DNA topoisomerase I [Rhodospirillaceae bacterium]|nr:DNA topoisomerase I [Rhodospirillaceae bacterium]|tara:strand:+ start:1941 stop:4490 length:2550 start_codon:yes stop_codon:yes gene_type:complete